MYLQQLLISHKYDMIRNYVSFVLSRFDPSRSGYITNKILITLYCIIICIIMLDIKCNGIPKFN